MKIAIISGMNSLQQKISDDLKDAMRNREALRLETIRSIKTAFTNELVTLKRTPQDELEDNEALTVIKRLHKQRIEASDQFKAAGRDDLADKEAAEAEILATYLPQQMSDSELEALVTETLSELDITDKSKMGIAIGAVVKKADGKADGKRVQAEIVKQLG